MSKVLVDTNILIYAIDEDSRYHSPASQLLHGEEHELFTTSKNISEFLTVVTKPLPKALSIDEALNAIEDITSNLTVLFPSPSSFSIFINLLKKYQPTGLRIHDFEIVSIGLDNGINRIATTNKKDFLTITEIAVFVP
jgi:predicted nucleic acid-binding protein